MQRHLLVALLFLPLAGAAPMGDDGSADVKIVTQGQESTLPAGPYDAIDLRSIAMEETRTGFIVTAGVTDLNGGTGDTFGSSGYLAVFFRHNDRDFLVVFGQNFAGGEDWWASLQSQPTGSGRWDFHWWDPDIVVEDYVEHTLSVEVPRADLADTRGAPPSKGRVLDSFVAYGLSWTNQITQFRFAGQSVPTPTPYIYDRLPDDGLAPGILDVTFGPEQTGHVWLGSSDPYRASNGEATTFVFPVMVANRDTEEDGFLLGVTNVPSGWTIDLPVPAVIVEGGEMTEVPVIVTTPFGHQHGGAEAFVVEATSQRDETAVGRVELGVRYLSIPQPAGHHDTIFLHSRSQENFFSAIGEVFPGSSAELYMNTLDDFESDEKIPVPAFNDGWRIDADDSGPYAQYRWFVPLDPGLLMGLDFDLSREGTIVLPLQSDVPVIGGNLTGDLMFLTPGNNTWTWPYGFYNATRIAEVPPTQVEIGATETHTVEAPIRPFQTADLLPYAEDQNIVLELRLRVPGAALFVTPSVPKILPGGYLRLPLFEYADPITESFVKTDGPQLTVEGTPTRPVNPGGVVVWEVLLSNPDETRTFDVTLGGIQTDWARVQEGEKLRVQAGGSLQFHVIVEVPADAKDKDRADLIVQAAAADDPTVRGLIRLVAEVDTEATHPDDRDRLAGFTDESKDTPMPAALVLLALLALVLRRRP